MICLRTSLGFYERIAQMVLFIEHIIDIPVNYRYSLEG